MSITNRKIILKQPPLGVPRTGDFEMISEPMSSPGDGEMLLRTRWLTLDPYMRIVFMADPKHAGKTIIGGTLSEVIESRAAGWNTGDLVVGYYGWQEYNLARPDDVQWNHPGMPIQKWDCDLGPASTALGILGMTGYTAYEGLLNVARVKAGETVVVSAASGAVGQVVGQLAKIRGARAVGIAGGPEKCRYCVEELGFDACIDYKAGNLPGDLATAVPGGIDIYFENVGGEVLEAVIPLLNAGARVPVCGFVAQYNDTPEQRQQTPMRRLRDAGLGELGKDHPTQGYGSVGFSNLSGKHPDAENALREMSGWIKIGRLKYRESITEGLGSAPEAFIGMLAGRNFGKTLVKVS